MTRAEIVWSTAYERDHTGRQISYDTQECNRREPC